MLPFKGIVHDTMGFLHIQPQTADGRRSPCGDFELNYVECLEAYGISKGNHVCHKYLEDLTECKSQGLTIMRVQMMSLERDKKILKGEIPFSKRYSEPIPYDAFVYGSFMP